MADQEFRTQLNERLDRAVSADPAAERTLRLAAAALEMEGECRLAEPYKPLRLVLGKDGLRWCCTHVPEHCADAVVDLRP